MSRVLIVEDDALVADFVSRGLQAHGHSTLVTDEADHGAALGLSGDFDLMILDIGLPGGDGFAVLEEVRGQGGRVPIIVLTGRTDQREAVACLDRGADDYMTKPFRFDELLARVRVRVRVRHTGTDEPVTLTSGNLTLDLRSRRAEVGGAQVDLTAREFAILELFLRHPAANDGVVSGNDVRFNPTGIELQASGGNRIEANNASNATGSGIELEGGSLGNDLLSNIANANAGNGIFVASEALGVPGNLLDGNTASGNGEDGIHVAEGGHTLRGNTANSNLVWGIFAELGNTDGGGNRASGNGEPAQCSGVRC